MLYVVVCNLFSGFSPIRHILSVSSAFTDDIISDYYSDFVALIGDSFVVFDDFLEAQKFADSITRSFYDEGEL